MGLIARFTLSLLVGIATFFFVFWVPFSLLSFLPGHLLLAPIGSLVAAAYAVNLGVRAAGSSGANATPGRPRRSSASASTTAGTGRTTAPARATSASSGPVT